MSNIYEQAGAMHFLPGMKFSIECLVREVVAMKQRAGLPTSDARTLSEQVVAILLGNGTATIIEAKVSSGKSDIIPFLEQQALLNGPSPVKSPDLTPKELTALDEMVRRKEAPKKKKNTDNWTEEKRALYAERMREARKTGAVKPTRELKPEVKLQRLWEKFAKAVKQVGEGLTIYGLADQLGVTAYRVRNAIERLHARGKRVKHPVNKGARIDIYPATVIERLRKDLARPTGGQVLPNHPRNAGHPKHDEWRMMMSRAQQQRVARLKLEKDIAYVNGAAAS